MTLRPGTRLARFEIVRPLGSGGMGEVYRARDTSLDRDVALKLLPPAVAADAARLERFGREARALAALSHPNIVTIYSVEDDASVRFFTMELIEGATLSGLIPAGGLALSRVFEIALPLADALGAAHEKGIVHRDLTPSNVMVDGSGRVKILDFGLAKADVPVTAAAITSLTTSPGMVFGTAPYMAPEQISAQDTDARTDVFSFGTILYEMAAGARPFKGDSSPAVMSSILRDDPPPLGSRRPELPVHFARIVHRCLEKSPADRYQTMREVQRELRGLKNEVESNGPRGPSGGGVVQSISIGVHPFKLPASASDLQAFGEGLVEDITAGLSRFPYLSVAARDAAQHTRYVLEGSIRRGGSTIRVSVQLVDGQAGTQLWAETYNRDLSSGDIFGVQDDVTDRVVATVADVYGVLARSMMHTIREIPIDHLMSSELLLRYWSYHHNPKADEHARLRAAMEAMTLREANNAEVWAALAYLYCHEHSHWFNEGPEALARARRAARTAIALEPGGQHGWETLAIVLFFEKDREAFLAAAERAIQINPRNTNTAAFLALLFGHSGDTERAFAIVQRARILNSHHPGWYHCVEFARHYLAGDHEAAYVAIKQVNMPELVFPQILLACVCGQLGRDDESRSAIRAAFALEPSIVSEQVFVELGRRWFLTSEVHERFYDGFRKALATLQ